MNAEEQTSVDFFKSVEGGNLLGTLKVVITRIPPTIKPTLVTIMQHLLEELPLEVGGFHYESTFDITLEPPFNVDHGNVYPRFEFREKKGRLIEKVFRSFAEANETIDAIFMEVSKEGYVTSAWQLLNMRLTTLQYEPIRLPSYEARNRVEYTNVIATFTPGEVKHEVNDEFGLVELAKKALDVRKAV